MFDKLRYRCFERKASRLWASGQRARAVHNLSTARSVALVVQVCEVEMLDQVLAFKQHIETKGSTVTLLIYYPKKEIASDFLLRKNVDIVDYKLLNWLRIPISPVVDNFLTRQFDLLIDLSLNEILPVRWISTASTATFKVGLLKYPHNPFDLIVNTDLSGDYTKIFNAIETVLSLFK